MTRSYNLENPAVKFTTSNGDVLVMTAVVLSPHLPFTPVYAVLQPSAHHVIQPDFTLRSRITVADELTDISGDA